MQRIIAIVPRLPPAIDGIGDYAIRLAQGLQASYGLETHFITGDPHWQKISTAAGFNVNGIAERTSASLFRLLEQQARSGSTILLHYVLHGFAKRGCPFWLIDALEQWRQQYPDTRLVTMFHEIYSRGSSVVPWKSDFWLLPGQKQIARRVAQLSDGYLTSSTTYAELLNRLYPKRAQQAVKILPIPCTIAEPTIVPSLAQRHPRLIIFGQGGNKNNVYQSLAQLQYVCQCLKINEIWDIGPTATKALAAVDGIPVIQKGKLDAAAVSEILLSSQVGVLSYYPELLPKSSIFSAYCAHGLVPVNLTDLSRLQNSTISRALSLDGLGLNQQYWLPDRSIDRQMAAGINFASIADQAHRWYQAHNAQVQVESFAQFLPTRCNSLPINASR
jgi:hypothetical protein